VREKGQPKVKLCVEVTGNQKMRIQLFEMKRAIVRAAATIIRMMTVRTSPGLHRG